MEATEVTKSKVTKASCRVKVSINCRPILPIESMIHADQKTSKNVGSSSERAVTIKEQEGRVMVSTDKAFQFDAAFDGHGRQDDLYKRSVKPLVHSFIKNCDNASVMAYGQTGSGKTHTMMGGSFPDLSSKVLNDCSSRGMILRAIQDVFVSSNPITDTISVSYFEIYNEKLYDLLSNDKIKAPLSLREENHRFQIPDLSIHTVKEVNTALQYVKDGNKSRSTANTAQNETSSRSHALFRIYLHRQIPYGFNTELNNGIKNAWLTLVDLAGSESVRKTEADGERFNEGRHINKGLLSLGNCIADICHGKKHIPFRDSTLTKVLRESFQQGGWTAMIACISPTKTDICETLKTLRYADRTKLLKKAEVPVSNYKELSFNVSNQSSSTLNECSIPTSKKRVRYSCDAPIDPSTKRLKMIPDRRNDISNSTFSLNRKNDVSSPISQSRNISGVGLNVKKVFLKSEVHRETDEHLQNIKEEKRGIVISESSRIEDNTCDTENLLAFEPEISRISPHGNPKNETLIISEENLTSCEAHIPADDAIGKSTTTNVVIGSKLGNTAPVDASNLSPMVKKISEYVGKQFEKRFGQIEENFYEFVNSKSTFTKIPEKVVDEAINNVKSLTTEEKKCQLHIIPSPTEPILSQDEIKKLKSTSEASTLFSQMSTQTKCRLFEDSENIIDLFGVELNPSNVNYKANERNLFKPKMCTKEVYISECNEVIESSHQAGNNKYRTPRKSMLRIQNFNTPGKSECKGAIKPNDAGYTLRKGRYSLRKGRKSCI